MHRLGRYDFVASPAHGGLTPLRPSGRSISADLSMSILGPYLGSPRVPSLIEIRAYIRQIAGEIGVFADPAQVNALAGNIALDMNQHAETGDFQPLQSYRSLIEMRLGAAEPNRSFLPAQSGRRSPPGTPSPIAGGGSGSASGRAAIPPAPAADARAADAINQFGARAKALADWANELQGGDQRRIMNEARDAYSQAQSISKRAKRGQEQAAKRLDELNTERAKIKKKFDETPYEDQAQFQKYDQELDRIDAERRAAEAELEAATAEAEAAQTALDNVKELLTADPTDEDEETPEETPTESPDSAQLQAPGGGSGGASPEVQGLSVVNSPTFYGPPPGPTGYITGGGFLQHSDQPSADDCIKVINDCAKKIALANPHDPTLAMLSNLASAVARAAGAPCPPCDCNKDFDCDNESDGENDGQNAKGQGKNSESPDPRVNQPPENPGGGGGGGGSPPVAPKDEETPDPINGGEDKPPQGGSAGGQPVNATAGARGGQGSPVARRRGSASSSGTRARLAPPGTQPLAQPSDPSPINAIGEDVYKARMRWKRYRFLKSYAREYGLYAYEVPKNKDLTDNDVYDHEIALIDDLVASKLRRTTRTRADTEWAKIEKMSDEERMVEALSRAADSGKISGSIVSMIKGLLTDPVAIGVMIGMIALFSMGPQALVFYGGLVIAFGEAVIPLLTGLYMATTAADQYGFDRAVDKIVEGFAGVGLSFLTMLGVKAGGASRAAASGSLKSGMRSARSGAGPRPPAVPAKPSPVETPAKPAASGLADQYGPRQTFRSTRRLRDQAPLAKPAPQPLELEPVGTGGHAMKIRAAAGRSRARAKPPRQGRSISSEPAPTNPRAERGGGGSGGGGKSRGRGSAGRSRRILADEPPQGWRDRPKTDGYIEMLRGWLDQNTGRRFTKEGVLLKSLIERWRGRKFRDGPELGADWENSAKRLQDNLDDLAGPTKGKRPFPPRNATAPRRPEGIGPKDPDFNPPPGRTTRGNLHGDIDGNGWAAKDPVGSTAQRRLLKLKDFAGRLIDDVLESTGGKKLRTTIQKAMGHAEPQAIGLIRRLGIKKGYLDLNIDYICSGCWEIIPRMMPEGGTLIVRLIDRFGKFRTFEFQGKFPPTELHNGNRLPGAGSRPVGAGERGSAIGTAAAAPGLVRNIRGR